MELTSISSDQLSESYRKTITPIWIEPPEPAESPVPQVKPAKGTLDVHARYIPDTYQINTYHRH